MPEKNRITKKRLQTIHRKAGLLMLLVLLFQTSTVLAQRPDSVKINGIYHYIYPYPQEVRTSGLFEWAFNYQMESEREKISKRNKKRIKIILQNPDLFCGTRFSLEKDVTPSLDRLPDGKYVQYYTNYYKLNKKKKFIPDSTTIAGFFELQDNLLEGNAYWISTQGDTIKKGRFHRGLKEGIWTVLTPEYINPTSSPETLEKILKSGAMYTVKNQTFANGIFNGSSHFMDKRHLEKGFYTDGKESGEWSFYEKNLPGNNSIDSFVLVKHYVLANNNIKSHKPFVRSTLLKPSGIKYYQFKDCSQEFVHFGTMRKLDKESEFEREYNNVSNYGVNNYPGFVSLVSQVKISKFELIHSGYINQYSFYEAFYPNGQLKIRMKFENGNLLSEDTIFSDNGKPMDVVLYDAEKKQYENKLFDCEGTVYEINLYDSLGVFVKQLQDPFYRDKHIFIDGIECFYQDEIFRYRNPDFFTQPLQGEILLNKSWYADTSECNERRYNASTHKLVSEMKSINGKKMEEYSCTFSPDFNTASGFRIYYLKELKSVQSFTQNYYKSLLETEDSLIRKRLKNPEIGSKAESETTLKFKEEPFSGRAVFRFDRNTPRFSIQKNSIKIDLTSDKFYEILEKDRASYRKTGKTNYPDVLSITQTFNYRKALYNIFPVLESTGSRDDWDEWDLDYKERNRMLEGKFVNGKPEGTWIMYNKDHKIVKRIRYVNGKLNGVYQQYDIQQPRRKHFDADFMDTFTERETLFLAQETSYENGVKNGPVIYYDWLGNVIRKEHFRNGVSSGEAFERNSMASVTLNFENGLKQGVERTTIHIPGKDSLLIRERTFEKGVLQGEAREYHTNGKLAKKEFYDNGKRVWIHEVHDSLGNMTMQLKYKNYLPFEQSFWESGELNIKYEFSQRDSTEFNKNVLSRSGLGSYSLIDINYTPPRGRGGAQFYKNLVRYNYTKPTVQERERRMTKYFPNGNVARTGDLKEDTKTGIWKYFSYNGQKMYEVNYFDTTISVNDSLKFKSFGILSAFDEKEALVSKSYLIEKSEKYDCSNSDHYEIRQFYTFWQAGNSQNKINGFVKNYYDNGVLQSEGNMQNGLPTGIWKYYDPFGKLNEVGEYKTGKHEGRWIKGDLEKIKYLGDICMDPNLPNLEEKIRYKENLLDIQILYFKRGKLIATESYDLNLNK